MEIKSIESLKSFLKDSLEVFLDIIYPYKEKCIICEEVEELGLCKLCESKIKRVKTHDDIIAYGTYGNILKSLILEMKYKKNFIAIDILAELLIKLIEEEALIGDIILYIPMTKKAIKKRGFNQCELLAKRISKKTGIKVCDYLYKTKDTKEQKTLTREERMKNVQGVFDVKDKNSIKDRRIILIDDVVTTGATVLECKKILKNLGAKEVNILTISKSNI